MQKLLLFAILSCSGPLIQAQDYIVTLQKDTLRGEVSIPLPKEFVEEVRLETEDSKDLYKVHQVLSVFTDSTFYEPVKLINKYRFMKVVEPGYLTLYLYRADQSYDFNTFYLQKRSLEGIEVPNISFRKVIIDFLENCPSLVEKIENKTYRKNDLKEIVAEYNLCITDRTEMIYEANAENVADEGQTEAHPGVTIIRGIQAKIDKESKAELFTLLSDIKTKLSKNQPVPGYLKSALKEQTSGMSNIENEVSELLKALD